MQLSKPTIPDSNVVNIPAKVRTTSDLGVTLLLLGTDPLVMMLERYCTDIPCRGYGIVGSLRGGHPSGQTHHCQLLIDAG